MWIEYNCWECKDSGLLNSGRFSAFNYKCPKCWGPVAICPLKEEV